MTRLLTRFLLGLLLVVAPLSAKADLDAFLRQAQPLKSVQERAMKVFADFAPVDMRVLAIANNGGGGTAWVEERHAVLLTDLATLEAELARIKLDKTSLTADELLGIETLQASTEALLDAVRGGIDDQIALLTNPNPLKMQMYEPASLSRRIVFIEAVIANNSVAASLAPKGTFGHMKIMALNSVNGATVATLRLRRAVLSGGGTPAPEAVRETLAAFDRSLQTGRIAAQDMVKGIEDIARERPYSADTEAFDGLIATAERMREVTVGYVDLMTQVRALHWPESSYRPETRREAEMKNEVAAALGALDQRMNELDLQLLAYGKRAFAE